MCIPLINGIYGSEGVLYLTAYLTFFNVLIWTHGLMTMKGERDFSSLVKALVSPSVIAVVVGLICYLTNIRLPKVPATALQYIADMNTPIAMVIAGATAAQTNVESPSKPPYLLRFTVQAHNTPCGRLPCSVDIKPSYDSSYDSYHSRRLPCSDHVYNVRCKP